MKIKIIKSTMGLILLTIIFVGCKSSGNNDFHPMPKVPPIPYYLDAERMQITVDDTLLHEDQRATMLVSIFQDKNANILGFNIYAFTLVQEDKVDMNYERETLSEMPKSLSDVENYLYKKETYPKEIQPFYESLNQYLETLEFTIDENVEPKEVNIALFNFRFYGS